MRDTGVLSRLAGWGASCRVPRKRWWLVAVALVMVFFLFTPKAEENACIHNTTFFGAAVIPHNCDSVSMVNELGDIGGYLTEPNVWKGRPLYMLSGYALGQALMPITKPVWTLLLKRNSEAQSYKKSFGKNFHLHVAFILFNMVIVFAAARYAIFLSGLKTTQLTAIALAISVASVDLVEGFLYVLHTSLFNYVSAIGAAAYVAFGITARLRMPLQDALLGVLIGIGVLMYPAIAILVPAYIVGIVYGHWVLDHKGDGRQSLLAHVVLFGVGAVALPVLWMLLNSYVLATSTYATASEYGQFAWPLEALRNGTMVETSVTILVNYTQVLVSTMKIELSLCAVAGFVLVALGGRNRGTILKDPALFCLLIAALGVLGFNYLQGLYEPRMFMAVLALLYIAIARLSYLLKQEKIGFAALGGIGVFQLVDAALNLSLQYS